MPISAMNKGFQLASVESADRLRTVARFRCVECPAALDVPLRLGIPLDPEGLSKRANAQGWKTHPWRASNTYCPRCAGPPKVKNDPDSELRKVVPMSPTIPPKPSGTPVIVREPTADQKVQIRAHLDKSFDDSVGRYLDGLSDQRIAELVGVPRIVVERIRETAYGQLKITSEMAELLDAAAALKAEVAKHQDVVAKLVAKASELASKIERLTAGSKVA